MNVESTIRNLRVMLRANTIIAGIHGRRLAARSGLNAFAGLIGAFGLLMLGVAVFFALEKIWGPVWASAAVGGFNIVLAAILVLVAGRMQPGRELDLATEVRDAAVDAVTGDLRAVEADLAALAHAIRHPFDSTLVAGLATPLVAMLLKAAKKEKGEAESGGPDKS
jgi:hypothetical protein